MQQKFFYSQSRLGPHRLAYTEFGKAGNRPPVVCLHGLTRNGRDFDPLAEALAASGRRVYCPDMAGRGQSDWFADPALYTYEQYLADITAFLLYVQEPVVDWVGTSMGGLLGLILAGNPVSPIRRLIINDVGPSLSATAIKDLIETTGWRHSFASMEEVRRYIRLAYRGFGSLTETQWDDLAEHSAQPTEDGRWILSYDPALADGLKNLNTDLSFWPFYAATSAPVLVLRGANSQVLPESVARRMAVVGPKAKLATFPGVGHAPALMAEDQIHLVLEFLNG